MPAIGLFDLDGSLADHDYSLLRDLQRIASPGEPELANIWESDSIPHMKARVDLIRNQPGWWESLQTIEAGFNVFQKAYRIGFCCEILTKGPRTKSLAWKEKVDWCQNHFGEDIPIHIVTNKGRVYGKFLYDDYPEYMLKWLEFRPRGLGIMPVRPSNKDFSHPNVLMYYGPEHGSRHNFDEISNALEKCYERKKGETVKWS